MGYKLSFAWFKPAINQLQLQGIKSRSNNLEILRSWTEGKTEVKRKIQSYNQDAILSIGYRVNSIKATQVRIWQPKS